MGVVVYNAAADAREWARALPERDVYFLPDYVRLHCLEPGVRARLFLFEEGGERWAYPFLQQPVPGLPGHFDLESPYGYAGPLATTGESMFLAAAHRSFLDWAREECIVAEFIRFHPLLRTERWVDPDVEVLLDRTTRSIDIPGEGDVLSAFSGKARNMARRAERAGPDVSRVAMRSCAERFAALYRQGMDRARASSYYYFNQAYFELLADLTDREGFLLAARVDGEWEGAAVFLYGLDTLHYHLATASPERRVPGVANLLIAEAARRAREAGILRLHLGGGRTSDPDDSLLRFKRSMGAREHDFLIGKRVLDAERYRELKESWCSQYPDLVDTYGARILCYRYRP